MKGFISHPKLTDDENLFSEFHNLKKKINSINDLKKFSSSIKKLENNITIFHAKAVKQILKETKTNIDFIGFHGQTIYHNAKEKISKQLGTSND